MTIIERQFIPPEDHYFLLGPRGTGKSTWLTNYYHDALLINLLDINIRREFSARPEYLKTLIQENLEKKIICIDEVQKVPDILNVVHELIETKKGLKFVLTGSSARKIRNAGVNLLGGRAIKKTLHPFMANEIKAQFNLEAALRFGMLPLIYSVLNKEEKLQAYISLYIEEEVQQEGLTRNIGDFYRFLETISFSQGAILNISNIAVESQVKRKTVEGYISILEDLLIAYQIPVFAKKAKRALIAHPKFYFFDTGVFRILRPKGPLDMSYELDGICLESLVMQHLYAWCHYSKGSHNLYFWRTKNGIEVDFIIYGDSIFRAIEVKNTSVIRSQDIHSLKQFVLDYPQCEPLFLYRGKRKQIINGITCLPVADFLFNLQLNL